MAMTLITTNTSSNAASSSFTSGIDSTYKLYIFKFYDVNPVTDAVNFTFQANVVDASGYNETITSTAFRAYHAENNGDQSLGYYAAYDQAQGEDPQTLANSLGNGTDESCAGELHLFNPSSTTYAKHFYSRFTMYWMNDKTNEFYGAGYINTTTAIDDIQFTMASGNFDGTIKLWGVK